MKKLTKTIVIPIEDESMKMLDPEKLKKVMEYVRSSHGQITFPNKNNSKNDTMMEKPDFTNYVGDQI